MNPAPRHERRREWLPSRRSIVSRLLLVGAAIAAVLIRGPHYGDDAVVLVVFTSLAGAGRRAAVCLLSILTFVATFPPFELPLGYFACFAPVAWLWRRSDGSLREILGEAFGVGFAMCWLTSPFIRADFPSSGVVIQGLAGALFGLQVAAVATAIRSFRHRSVVPAALTVAAIATGLEVGRVYLLHWPLLALAFPAAPTPLAQWAAFVSPFGVSWILYAINFLLVPTGPSWRRLGAWIGPAAALALGACGWIGGELIARRVPETPLPFSVLLVQPHRIVGGPASGEGKVDEPSLIDQLVEQTREALERDGPVDLVVWPETVIRRADGDLVDGRPSASLAERQLHDLGWVFRHVVREFGLLAVGAVIRGDGGRQFNSALLIDPAGRIDRYDKRRLVIGAEGQYTPGAADPRFLVRTRDGREVPALAALCYEIHFPALIPRGSSGPSVVVNLNNESMYRRYPGQHGHATWACRYRAIESRSWQLVCASWTRSAVIDPRGRVLERLGPSPGVIRYPPGPSGAPRPR